MNKQYLFLPFLLVSAAALGGTVWAQHATPKVNVHEQRYESWKAFQPRERFSGQVLLKSSKGQSSSLEVNVRVWSLDAVRGPQKLSVPEFTIFHLRAGTLTTIIDDKKEVRKSDDFWVLPAGSQISVQVKGEAAVLETTGISPK